MNQKKIDWFAVFEQDGVTRFEKVTTRSLAVALHLEGWKKVGIANSESHGIESWPVK